MNFQVPPNLTHSTILWNFTGNFFPGRICWSVQGAATQTPGTRTAFLVGRCPNLHKPPQPELLPLGKGSRNLPNVRSGICRTMLCLCSALTFPAPIPHYLARHRWLLSSPWQQKSCKEPSLEENVCFVADTSLTSARASFPGSEGIRRTVAGHILLLGVPAPFGPMIPASQSLPLGFPHAGSHSSCLLQPSIFQLPSLIFPEVESLSRLCPAVSLGIMVKYSISHLIFIRSLRHGQEKFHTLQQMLGKSSRGKGPESTQNDGKSAISPKWFDFQY